MAKNKKVIDEAFKSFEKQIIDTAETELKKYCWKLLQEAIIARQQNPGAHNFTGNLLNSIVVCLYRERKPVIAYYASDLVPEAIRPKMNLRIRRRVFFNPDYDGEKSAYLPKVKTDGGWGKDDAREFFSEYIPSGSNLFDIVVGYTVEYAEWVQYQRATTGYVRSLQYAESLGRTFLQIGS